MASISGGLAAGRPSSTGGRNISRYGLSHDRLGPDCGGGRLRGLPRSRRAAGRRCPLTRDATQGEGLALGRAGSPTAGASRAVEAGGRRLDLAGRRVPRVRRYRAHLEGG